MLPSVHSHQSLHSATVGGRHFCPTACMSDAGCGLCSRDTARTGLNRISPVKQQGQCNSCTSFATVAAAEAAVASAMNVSNAFDFSEQVRCWLCCL